MWHGEDIVCASQKCEGCIITSEKCSYLIINHFFITQRKEGYRIYTVYMHENKINGKRYIGITSRDVSERWKNGYGYSERLPIGRAFRKYGWDNFHHIIFCENLSESEAKKMEIDLIKMFRTCDRQYGYNICTGGDGVAGWHPSEETRKKISEAAKQRTGIKNPNYGNKWSDEMKRTAGIKHRKENLSEETLRHMSEAAKKRCATCGNSFAGKKHTNKTKAIISEKQSRPVKMFDKFDNLLCEFASIKKAAEETKINKVSISNCCRGTSKSAGGYIWKYSKIK